MREWDTNTTQNKRIIHVGRALNCISCSSSNGVDRRGKVGNKGGANLIAAGSSDSLVRVWDSRSAGDSAAIRFTGHTGK